MTEATNQIDPSVAKRWISEWERHDEEILTIKMENAARQKVVKDRQKEVVEAAVSAGLPREAFKLEIKLRKLRRQQDELESEAGNENVYLAEQIRTALGDFGELPLGGAAIERAQAESRSAPKRRGRPRKDAHAEAASAQDGAAALNSLIDGDDAPSAPANDDDRDLRPPFLTREDEEQANANEALLAGGISELKH